MQPQACICCGEWIPRKSSAHSRHQGVCASCSSMLDGMDRAEELEWIEANEGFEVSLATAVSLENDDGGYYRGHWGINE